MVPRHEQIVGVVIDMPKICTVAYGSLDDQLSVVTFFFLIATETRTNEGIIVSLEHHLSTTIRSKAFLIFSMTFTPSKVPSTNAANGHFNMIALNAQKHFFTALLICDIPQLDEHENPLNECSSCFWLEWKRKVHLDPNISQISKLSQYIFHIISSVASINRNAKVFEWKANPRNAVFHLLERYQINRYTKVIVINSLEAFPSLTIKKGSGNSGDVFFNRKRLEHQFGNHPTIQIESACGSWIFHFNRKLNIPSVASPGNALLELCMKYQKILAGIQRK